MNTELHSPPHHHATLLSWSLGAGVFAFLIYVVWREGALVLLLEGDQTYLSLLIASAFVVINSHAVARVVSLSHQRNCVSATWTALCAPEGGTSPMPLRRALDSLDSQTRRSLVVTHIGRLTARAGAMAGDDAGLQAQLISALEKRVRTDIKFGWLCADLMIKLGLLGTVIGFILMLGSVVAVEDYDISTLRDLMRAMSDGMRVALFTTLTGLLAGLVLGFQYQFLDRHTDQLVAEIQELTEVCVLPALTDGLARAESADG